MEIISNWNDNEYGNGSDIHLPRGNCEINKNELSDNNWVLQHNYLTDEDKQYLKNESKNCK